MPNPLAPYVKGCNNSISEDTIKLRIHIVGTFNMLTMLQSSNVYVTASSIPAREDKSLSASRFKIIFVVTTSHTSDPTRAGPGPSRRIDSWASLHKSRSESKEIKNSQTKCFVRPCQSFTSEEATPSSSSWKAVSSLIANETVVPFPLDNIQWREFPEKTWTKLEKQDDVVKNLLDFIRSKGSTISNDAGPRELILKVDIHKKVLLPDTEFQAMMDQRRAQERAQQLSEAVSYVNQLDPRHRRLYLDLMRQNGVDLESIAIRESEHRTGSMPIPAAKSAIEALKKVTYDSVDSKECAICMENLVVGLQVICLPCRHMFHPLCLIAWLHISHMCPICRHELPTE